MLIAISGKARAGKDTLGSVMQKIGSEAFNKDIKLVSFAYKLKKIAMDNFYLSDEQVNGSLKEQEDPRWGYITPRAILQKLGTSYREIYPNYWIDAVISDYKRDESQCFVITDCRYKNEANAVIKAGGIVVRVNRPDIYRGKVTDPTHGSEVDLDDFQMFYDVVDNSKSIEDLVIPATKILYNQLYEEQFSMCT